MAKNKIISLTWASFTIVMLIFVIIDLVKDTYSLWTNIMIILWFIYALFLIVTVIVEQNKIKNSRKESVDVQINFWKNVAPKFIIFSSENSCKANLSICFLKNNNIKEAKEVIKDIDEDELFIIYPKFLISVAEYDLSSAHTQYDQLMEIKDINYEEQKRYATKVIHMIDERKFDQELCDDTSYPFVKELNIKYSK